MGEIFALIKKEKSNTKKADLLRQYDSPVLRGILELAYDARLTWALPEGRPPFSKLEKSFDAQGHLYSEMRRMYLFLVGEKSKNLTGMRREQLFVNLLEELDPDDAELILECKERKITGVSKKLVLDTFDNFLNDEVNRPRKAG